MSASTSSLHSERDTRNSSQAGETPGIGGRHHGRPTGNLHRNQKFGSVRGTYTAGRRDLDGASQMTGVTGLTNPETPNTERLGWIDEEYMERNPWHFKPKDKPVFSLGRPLPRVVRAGGSRRGKQRTQRPLEELAERGELEISHTNSNAYQTQSRQSNHQAEHVPQHTAAGTAHNDKRNGAGQPVFDYVPGNDYDAGPPSAQDTTSPEFKIDGEPLGQRDADEVKEGNGDPNEYRNWWARVRAKHPEPLAEFLSTGVAIFLGLAGSLSVYLSQSQDIPYGSYETSCWAWGFAWMFGVYLGGGVSGAHMNPAISISLSVFRGFPWRQCAVYVVVQFIAAIVAGALAYGCFADTIHYVDPSLEDASKAFLSTPPDWVSPGSAFLNQAVGSAIMMVVVFALGDDQNNPPGAGMHAFVLGLLVTTLKMTLGFNIGSALNPASDFGPRLIAYAIGYRQHQVFLDPWWIYGPWVATIVGSFIGCAIYDSFVFVGSESPVNYSPRPPLMAKKRKQPEPDLIHDLTGLIEVNVRSQIHNGAKRKRASLYLVEVRRRAVEAFRASRSGRRTTPPAAAAPGLVVVLKIFPNARANEDDFRREIEANAELGRSTAVAAPEVACDLMLGGHSDSPSLRWPRCYGTMKITNDIPEGQWTPGDSESPKACHAILFEYFSGLDLLTKEDVTEGLAHELKQLLADLHKIRILHRDHVNHLLWPEVAFHNLFLRTSAQTGIKDLVILDFDKALILGETVRDKKLLREEAERMSDLLEKALTDPTSKTIPKEVQRLLVDR